MSRPPLEAQPSIIEEEDEDITTTTTSTTQPVTTEIENPEKVQTDDDPSSGTTESADPALDGHDMMTSSYTAISFDSDSDIEDEYLGEREKTPTMTSDDNTGSRAVAGSLSLPQLSSTIASWSEKVAAEYEAEYGPGCSTRPSTAELQSSTSSYQVTEDGMVSFVASDFEQQLKLSSPSKSSASSQSNSTSYQIDLRLLQQLEEQATHLNQNVNDIMSFISDQTHALNKLTVECTNSYENCLTKTCDSVDANIRSMYYLMSKTEELNKTMTPIDQISDDVSQVKRVLEILEKAVP